MDRTPTTLTTEEAFRIWQEEAANKHFIRTTDRIEYDRFDTDIQRVVGNLVRSIQMIGCKLVEIKMERCHELGNLLVHCFGVCTQEEYAKKMPPIKEVRE